MAFISLVLVVLLIASLFLKTDSDKDKRAYLIIAVMALSFVAGLRAESVGTDTAAYVRMFYRIASCDTFASAVDASTIDAPVYVAAVWVVSHVADNHQVWLMLCAVATYALIARFIYLMSDNVRLSILYFILLCMMFQSMNGMRQYLSLALAINAYIGFSRNGIKSVHSWLLFAASVGIHSTAFCMLPACLFSAVFLRRPNAFKALKYFAISVIACVFLSSVLLDVFLSIFPSYAMYDGVDNIDIFSTEYGGRIILLYLLLAAIVVLAFFMCRRDGTDTIVILAPLAIIACVFGVAFARSFLFNRLIWYYLVCFIAFIPNAFARCSGKISFLLQFSTVSMLLVWMSMQLIENKDGIVPYMLGIA